MDVFALNLRLKEVGSATVTAAVGKLGKAADKAAKDMGGLDKTTDAFNKQLRNLAATLGTMVGAGATLRAIDAFATLNNQLKLATTSTEQFQKAQADVVRIAQQTNQPVEAVAELYGKVTRAAGALGLSQDEVAKLTRTVNQALLINKTEAGAAAGGLIQLSQALSGGVVRGEEFNSVIESMAPLIQGIEKELGLVPNSLRTLAIEGKLSSRDFAAAIIQNQTVAQTFANYTQTLSQQMGGLRNQFVLLIGKVAETTGVTKLLSDLIVGLTRNLPTVIAAIGSATAAWVAYTIAIRSAVVISSLLTSVETIAAFIALAKAVKTVADAAALVSLAGGGWLRIVGVIGGAVVGYTAFNAIQNKLASTMASVTGQINQQADATRYLANANATVHGLLAKTREINLDLGKSTKTYLETLIEVAAITPITKTEYEKLQAAETSLTAALKDGNLTLDARLKKAKELAAVQEAIGAAQVKLSLAESAQKFLIGATARTPADKGPIKVAPIDPRRLAKETVTETKAFLSEAQVSLLQDVNAWAQGLQFAIVEVLGTALADAISTAIQRGANIGDAFKALGVSLLQGLGSVLIQFGQRAVQMGILMMNLMKSFTSLNGPGMIAAGAAMIAIGAVLRGAASRAAGGPSSAPSSASIAPSLGSASGTMTLGGLTYGPTAAGSAATIQRVNPVSVTIIGPNDPAAQRQMQELITNANRRGSV